MCISRKCIKARVMRRKQLAVGHAWQVMGGPFCAISSNRTKKQKQQQNVVKSDSMCEWPALLRWHQWTGVNWGLSLVDSPRLNRIDWTASNYTVSCATFRIIQSPWHRVSYFLSNDIPTWQVDAAACQQSLLTDRLHYGRTFKISTCTRTFKDTNCDSIKRRASMTVAGLYGVSRGQ